MSEKLKPCPFCGAPGEMACGKGLFSVFCSNLEECGVGFTGGWLHEQTATDVWNRRAAEGEE